MSRKKGDARLYTGYASTLDELRAALGRHGDAAVNVAQWGAIVCWIMGLDTAAQASGILTNDVRVASVSVGFIAARDREKLNYPVRPGAPAAARTSDLSAEAKAEAERVAAEAVADWERAGCPNITREGLRLVQMHVQAFAQSDDQP